MNDDESRIEASKRHFAEHLEYSRKFIPFSGLAVDGPQAGKTITSDRPIYEVRERIGNQPSIRWFADSITFTSPRNYRLVTYNAHRLTDGRFIWSIHSDPNQVQLPETPKE